LRNFWVFKIKFNALSISFKNSKKYIIKCIIHQNFIQFEHFFLISHLFWDNIFNEWNYDWLQKMNDRLKNHHFFASVILKKVFFVIMFLKATKTKKVFFYNRTAYQRKRKTFIIIIVLKLYLKKGLKIVLKFKWFESKVLLFIKLFVNRFRSFMFWILIIIAIISKSIFTFNLQR